MDWVCWTVRDRKGRVVLSGQCPSEAVQCPAVESGLRLEVVQGEKPSLYRVPYYVASFLFGAGVILLGVAAFVPMPHPIFSGVWALLGVLTLLFRWWFITRPWMAEFFR